MHAHAVHTHTHPYDDLHRAGPLLEPPPAFRDLALGRLEGRADPHRLPQPPRESPPRAYHAALTQHSRGLPSRARRGACVSWSPKNLASAFIMSSIKDMAQTTQYRLFTAYSDPMAKELGTIYQACNFYYLGQTSGAATRNINPYTGKYVSDRFFRSRSAYKRYAKELGIRWRPDWCHATGMAWDNIPDDIEQQLREQSKVKHAESESIAVPPKHKYAMLCGANKKETAQLRARFSEINKTYEYPKDRGGVA